ncbi:MAG: hypothetical protein K9N06_11210 [Candidatus Cloacimonetes bacterium]|nr:hypothetical protein [Candidatus Cloacimonadota bacterium]
MFPDMDSSRRKKIKAEVLEALNEGKSREEVFNELSQIYTDKDMLRGVIVMIPNRLNVRKYKAANITIIVLLSYFGIEKLLWGISIITEFNFKAMLLLFALSFLNIFFIYEIIKSSNIGYFYLSYLAFIVFIRSFDNIANFTGSNIIFSVIPFFISILALFMKVKIYPQLGLIFP